MRLRNDPRGYGLVSVLLHWSMAALVIGLYALGKVIVDLDYDDPWYLKGPEWHLGLGALTALLLVIRLLWRLTNPRPGIMGRPWERQVALWVHRSFYVLIAAIVISGYLITTADGKPLSVFGWVEIPATLHNYPNQEDSAGGVHAWLADGLIMLAVMHGLAALKHHFIDRDATLLRMLGRHASRPSPTEATEE